MGDGPAGAVPPDGANDVRVLDGDAEATSDRGDGRSDTDVGDASLLAGGTAPAEESPVDAGPAPAHAVPAMIAASRTTTLGRERTRAGYSAAIPATALTS